MNSEIVELEDIILLTNHENFQQKKFSETCL